MPNTPKVTLKPGREKSLERRHPWVFSGAVERVADTPDPGDTVRVEKADGHFLAWGAWSPTSQLRVRVWSWQEADVVDEAFFRARLAAALQFRQACLPESKSNGRRLVQGEADGLPGLIVDQYGDVLVLQCLSIGVDVWRETVVGLLSELTGCAAIFERSDAEVRKLEGLEPRRGLVARFFSLAPGLPTVGNHNPNGLKAMKRKVMPKGMFKGLLHKLMKGKKARKSNEELLDDTYLPSDEDLQAADDAAEEVMSATNFGSRRVAPGCCVTM